MWAKVFLGMSNNCYLRMMTFFSFQSWKHLKNYDWFFSRQIYHHDTTTKFKPKKMIASIKRNGFHIRGRWLFQWCDCQFSKEKPTFFIDFSFWIWMLNALNSQLLEVPIWMVLYLENNLNTAFRHHGIASINSQFSYSQATKNF